MTPSQRAQVGNMVRTVLINGLAIVIASPLYYIVINTFKTTQEMADSPFGLPGHWSLQHYIDVFGTLPVVRSFVNSLIVTVLAVFFEVLIGALAAYGMILRKSKFTAAVGAVLIIAFCIPAQATLIPCTECRRHLGWSTPCLV